MTAFQSILYPLQLNRETSDLVLQAPVASTLNILYQPSAVCRLKISVFDLVGSGTCFIKGTDANDANIQEVLYFTEDDTQLSSLMFKSLTMITTSAFSGGQISVKGVLRSGEELVVRRSIRTVMGRIYIPKAQNEVLIPGAISVQTAKFICNPQDSDIQKGDYLFDDARIYQLETPLQPWRTFSTIHHYSAYVKRLES